MWENEKTCSYLDSRCIFPECECFRYNLHCQRTVASSESETINCCVNFSQMYFCFYFFSHLKLRVAFIKWSIVWFPDSTFFLFQYRLFLGIFQVDMLLSKSEELRSVQFMFYGKSNLLRNCNYNHIFFSIFDRVKSFSYCTVGGG